MHLLIILQQDSRVKEPADVDDVISAEFPDPETEPELFNIVLGMMTHQCGDRCTWKPARQETLITPRESEPRCRRCVNVKN